MTPTGKAAAHPREAQDIRKKRRRSQQTEKIHYADKRTCVREDTNEEGKTCQSGQPAGEINESAEEDPGQKRRHAVWGDTGLTEYNQPAKNANADLKTVNM